MNPSGNLSLAGRNEFAFKDRLHFLKPYLWLLIILLVAYAPLSTFYFGMKNDAFSDNFPNKYFLSEALHSGMLPLWNPYMNFGFPVYADVGFAFWNPITWLFALVGYNAYTLTIEVLLYIYLAGVFMYKLGRFLKFNQKLAVIVAAMYMCSGFFTGCLQYINFLTAAAFLPLLLMAYLSLLQKPGLRQAIILSFAGYMVFAGGHPAIPFAAFYFLLIFSILLFALNKSYINDVKASMKYLLVAIVVFLLIAAPAIYSYSSILDSYSRYAGQQNLLLNDTGFNPLSYLSFLFPLVTMAKQGVFGNDIAMRNAYISVVAVVAIIISMKYSKRLNLVFMLTGLLMLVLCAGGNFKQALYNNLPLLNYVRTNGGYRIFPILCFCISTGFCLQNILKNENARKLFLQYFTYYKFILLALIIALPAIYFAYFIDYVTSVFSTATGFNSVIKIFYDTGSFQLFLLKDAAIVFVFVWLMIAALKRRQYNRFMLLVAADLIVHTILYFPAIGIGRVTLNDIDAIYKNNPKGIIIPQILPVMSIDTFDINTTELVGHTSYYNKKIGTLRLTDYPSYFRTTEQYFISDAKDTISQMPYVFLNSNNRKNVPDSSVSVKEFKPTSFKIDITSQKNDTLVFLQNNYKFWKAYVNGKQLPVLNMYTTFMGVTVKMGDS